LRVTRPERFKPHKERLFFAGGKGISREESAATNAGCQRHRNSKDRRFEVVPVKGQRCFGFTPTVVPTSR
jgi:hypothetical protein